MIYEFYIYWLFIIKGDVVIVVVWFGYLFGLGWTYRIIVVGIVRFNNRLVVFSIIFSFFDSYFCYKILYLLYVIYIIMYLYYIVDDWILRRNRRFIIVF